MPELYGQPFKHQLRAETAELSRDLWSERRAHMKTRQSLRGARAKIEVLENDETTSSRRNCRGRA